LIHEKILASKDEGYREMKQDNHRLLDESVNQKVEVRNLETQSKYDHEKFESIERSNLRLTGQIELKEESLVEKDTSI
jgi:hypothetical protein